MTKQTDVLIIGGGFAGAAAAQKLAENGVDVMLVDRKDYFEVTFATVRNVTDPQRIGNTPRKLYRDFIKGTFIQATIASMNDKEATLTNGETIRFNRAIIASGSRYPTLPLGKSNVAFDYSERSQEMQDEHKKLAAAKSVLVIGGGTVGVEFAGDIASTFPDKEITLAHTGDRLLENAKPKAQRKALEQLTANGVKVLFNRRFAQDGDVYRDSKSNETLRPDIAHLCVGMVPNTEFLQAELPDILDGKGLIKVDSYMQVQGYENLYALGDCSNLDTNKHGYVARIQGTMLAEMLLKAAAGKKVKPYKTPSFAIITTTGTDSGVAQMPFGVLTWNFIVNLKQKDLGIGEIYKAIGTEPNKFS